VSVAGTNDEVTISGPAGTVHLPGWVAEMIMVDGS